MWFRFSMSDMAIYHEPSQRLANFRFADHPLTTECIFVIRSESEAFRSVATQKLGRETRTGSPFVHCSLTIVRPRDTKGEAFSI